MRTFSIHTLGCKVNQYESEQLATLLRARGLVQSDHRADLRIVNTCSVTMAAAGKSRQAVRRSVKLPVLGGVASGDSPVALGDFVDPGGRARLVVTGCWATSDRAAAAGMPGVDAVLGHHDNVAEELTRLLNEWEAEAPASRADAAGDPSSSGLIEAGAILSAPGTTSLPLLGEHQTGHQRAFIKIQDGCDAHCTYCIIPKLRSRLWSKPVDEAVEEAERLVTAGHVELVLTGIFLGAFGQPTALRRRQPHDTARPLGELIEALCTRVAGLRRIRLSSLEPGDLTPELIHVLKNHPQIVPHFHLPLQSGSDALLRKMNRQYTRDDFRRMVDMVKAAFDRPALTTDIIVGFPGETDAEFDRTIEIVDEARFIHTHAFSYSPRPNTAAARWTREFIRGPVVNERIELLNQRALSHSLEFRQSFVGETVELLVERDPGDRVNPGRGDDVPRDASFRHGRCERYFSVFFGGDHNPGDLLRVRIDRVTPHRTIGSTV